jgi:hypothetical protein
MGVGYILRASVVRGAASLVFFGEPGVTVLRFAFDSARQG